MKRKTILELAVVVTVALVAIVVWRKIAVAERSRLTPPSASTFKAFANSMPPPKQLAIVENGGSSKLVWVGETADWSLPSGPACYVFDAKGNLIQWNVTTGDGEPTTPLLVKAYGQKQMTVNEALTFVSRHGGK